MMATAATVRDLLGKLGVEYEEVVHPRAVSASRVAEAAHVPGDELAKAVLVKGGGGRFIVEQRSCWKESI